MKLLRDARNAAAIFKVARRLYRIGADNPQRAAAFGYSRLTIEQAHAQGMVAGLHPRAVEGLWPRNERPMVSTLRDRYRHANQPGYHAHAIRALRSDLNFRNVEIYRFGPGARLAQMEMLAMAARCVTAATAWRKAA